MGLMMYMFKFKLSMLFYVLNFTILLLYPLFWILVWKMTLNFIMLLHKNKVLIETIKNILEVFPESVIIRSYDSPNKPPSVKFINKTAQNDFGISNHEDISVHFVSKCTETLEDKEIYSLEEIFEQSENQRNLLSWDNELEIEVSSPENEQDKENISFYSKFYILRTMHVDWEDSK